ncbi:MAG: nucleoside recognition protein [Clostridiales bacterium]|nr:nucleoside recognition protein [Clostridiales bacterium]
MILIGIFLGILNGNVDEVVNAGMSGAVEATKLCIGFIGTYSMWLGFMKIAKRSGLIEKISNGMKGIFSFLFSDIPKGHPAIGAMAMNMAANMLGLGNAATPFGLKAMEYLQELNTNKRRATDAMCMFLVINASSLQLIPTTVIAMRSSAGAGHPTEIVGTTLIATTCSTAAGIISARLLKRWM